MLWINTPIGIAAALLAPLVLPRVPRTTGGRAASTRSARSPSPAAWSRSSTASSTASSRVSLAVAAALLVAFAIIETPHREPARPVRDLPQRSLTGATVTGVLMGGALIGLFFFATLYLQQVLDYGPLKAGVSFLPLALTIGASAGIASSLRPSSARSRCSWPASSSRPPACTGSRTSSAGGSFLGDVLFPSLVVALGMGLAFVPLTIAAMSGVSENESGLASGLMATAQQIGQAVGLADPDRRRHHDGATPEALTGGFEDAFLVAAGFALIAALAAFTIIRHVKAPPAGAAVPVPA